MGYSTRMNRVQASQYLLKVKPTGPFVKRLSLNEVVYVPVFRVFQDYVRDMHVWLPWYMLNGILTRI